MPIGALAVASYGLLAWISDDSGSFLTGFFAGAVVAVAVCLAARPPSYVENHQLGAWGEQRTAKVLDPLMREGWRIVHDVSRAKSNIDHLVIGPGGVFVLDSKNLSGLVGVRSGRLGRASSASQNPRWDDVQARSVRAQAHTVHQRISKAGPAPWVTGVVVLWADFPQGCTEGDRMTYVHGDQLLDWLRAKPVVLSTAAVGRIAELWEPGRHRAA